MELHRWRCTACTGRWVTTMAGESRCPFCGSEHIEGPGTNQKGRTMGLQPIPPETGTAPDGICRRRPYTTSRIRRRAVNIAPHADAGKDRPLATSATAPLRPLPLRWTASEGLLVPCAGKACPPQWRTPGRRAREYNGWASRETWGPLMGQLHLQGVGSKGQTALSRSGGAE